MYRSITLSVLVFVTLCLCGAASANPVRNTPPHQRLRFRYECGHVKAEHLTTLTWLAVRTPSMVTVADVLSDFNVKCAAAWPSSMKRPYQNTTALVTGDKLSRMGLGAMLNLEDTIDDALRDGDTIGVSFYPPSPAAPTASGPYKYEPEPEDVEHDRLLFADVLKQVNKVKKRKEDDVDTKGEVMKPPNRLEAEFKEVLKKNGLED